MLRLAAAAAGLALCAAPAFAQALDSIALPDEIAFPEGVAYEGRSGAVFTANAVNGAVARIDRDGRAQVIAPAGVLPPPGDGVFPAALGMKVDENRQLWIAGGRTGKLFVLNTRTGALARQYQTPGEGGLINDVALAGGHAYFTDSLRPTLWRVSNLAGRPGTLEAWLDFTGTPLQYDQGVNINGIAASPDGRTLIVVQMNKGLLYKIDVATRRVTSIDLGGETVPGADGLVLDGANLYVVRQPQGEVVTIALDRNRDSGRVVSRLADPALSAPATAAKAGDRLLVVNTQFNKRASNDPERPFRITVVPLSRLSGR